MDVRAPLHALRFGLILGVLAIAACTKPAPLPVSQDVEAPQASATTSPKLAGHTLTLSPSGFEQSCREPVLSVTSGDGGTRVIARTLPPKGMYFLDDKFVGYGTCDLITCSAASDRDVDLVEYEKIGMRPLPDGEGNAAVFRTVDLHGTITVTLQYFSDAKCTVPKTLTQTVVR